MCFDSGAADHVVLATLSKMSAVLLGAGWLLPPRSVVQTMDGDPSVAEPQPFCKAMDQLVVARVAQWRATHGVQQDEDFASDFCSFEEAALVAGPEVAGACSSPGLER